MEIEEKEKMKEALHVLLINGMIDEDAFIMKLNIMEEKERREILEKHKYKISEIEQRNGSVAYVTHLYSNTAKGHRTSLTRKTKSELEDAIIEHYKNQNVEITFSKAFYNCYDEKLKYDEITKATYDRYINTFKRFFSDESKFSLTRKKLSKVTEGDIEDCLKQIIKEYNLSRKSFDLLKIIVKGTFKYAKSHHYCNIAISSFFDDLTLPKFKTVKKTDSDEVFKDEEVRKILEYSYIHNEIRVYGIALNFYTGLRVGELSALKKEDINLHDRIIRVQRTEVTERDNGGKCVVAVKNQTKTDAGYREVLIPDVAINLLKSIMELSGDGEYLFERHGERVRGNNFNQVLSKVLNELKLPHRSFHKIRKTYASTLYKHNVPEAIITKNIGHTDIDTTRKYYVYANDSKEQELDEINNAISYGEEY